MHEEMIEEDLKADLLDVLEMKLVCMIAMQRPSYTTIPRRLSPKRQLDFRMLLDQHRLALRKAVLDDEHLTAEGMVKAIDEDLLECADGQCIEVDAVRQWLTSIAMTAHELHLDSQKT